MKVNDIVMFTNKDRYARWFFGQLATVMHYTTRDDGRSSCRVRWLNPVKYHDRLTTVSDFPAKYFEVMG